MQTKLDSLSIEDIRVISDINSLARTNYTSSRSLIRLSALLAVVYQLQLQLLDSDRHIENSSSENKSADMRRNRLARKMAEIHESALRKRISQVERMNDSKSSKMRSEKTRQKLVETLIESGAISSMLTNQREALREQRRLDKVTEAVTIQAQELRQPLREHLKEQGFDLSLPKEERDKQFELAKQGMPDTDLSKQADDILARMQALEKERISTDCPPQGTPEDWNKLL